MSTSEGHRFYVTSYEGKVLSVVENRNVTSKIKGKVNQMAELSCYRCKDWALQIAKINGPIVLQSVRAGRDLYDGKPFKYCPWCASKLRAAPATGTTSSEIPLGTSPFHVEREP